LKAKLWASPGALVRDTSTSRTHRIGTITPRWQKGRCVFLDTNDRCTIHRVAPFGCSHYDTHMPDSMANQRSAWALEQVLHSDDYQKLRAELPYATHYKPNEIE
jgi:Fe-S-cluster containining protein